MTVLAKRRTEGRRQKKEGRRNSWRKILLLEHQSFHVDAFDVLPEIAEKRNRTKNGERVSKPSQHVTKPLTRKDHPSRTAGRLPVGFRAYDAPP